MEVRIWHNPRCSKSRATLALLEERGVAPEVVLYVEAPPTPAELDTVCRKLGRAPQELLRAGEDLAGELGLAREDPRSREEWLELLCAHPILIERPIVVRGERAALGRPPEAVLELLG
jgi:arsenate reductase